MDSRKFRLGSYPHWEFDDADAALAHIDQRYRRVRQKVTSGTRFHVRFHAAKLDLLTVSSVSLESPLEITAQGDDRFYVLILLERDGFELHLQGRSFALGAGQGLLSPPVDQRILNGAALKSVFVNIPASLFQEEAARLFGKTVTSPLEVTGPIRENSAAGRLALYIVQELERPNGLFGAASGAGQQLERSLVTAILETTPHSYQNGSWPRKIVPFWHVRTCRRAEDHMDEHLLEPTSLGDLAHAAGKDGRRLQESFSVYRGKPPMIVLREKRLDYARRRLLEVEPYAQENGKSIVRRIAQECLLDPHEFPHWYAERFEELPSDVLRRRFPWICQLRFWRI